MTKSDELHARLASAQPIDPLSVLELRCDHPLGRDVLLRAVAAVLLTCPALRCRVIDSVEPALWEGREYALALCVDRCSYRSPLGVELGCMPLFLYASPNYLRHEGPISQLAALADRPVADIDFGADPPSWQVVSQDVAQTVRRPDVVVSSREAHAVLQFAVSGRGFAWLPPLIALDDLRLGSLEVAIGDAFRWSPTIHVCLPHRRKPRQEALDVIFAMAKVLKAASTMDLRRAARGTHQQAVKRRAAGWAGSQTRSKGSAA